MSIHSQDETTRSRPHRRVERVLTKMQIGYESECSFPPYSVDIYISEWHLGVEIDGPGHNAKRDEYRDAVLKEKYFLPVLRLPAEQNPVYIETVEKLEDFITKWAGSAEQRRYQYRTSL